MPGAAMGVWPLSPTDGGADGSVPAWNPLPEIPFSQKTPTAHHDHYFLSEPSRWGPLASMPSPSQTVQTVTNTLGRLVQWFPRRSLRPGGRGQGTGRTPAATPWDQTAWFVPITHSVLKDKPTKHGVGRPAWGRSGAVRGGAGAHASQMRRPPTHTWGLTVCGIIAPPSASARPGRRWPTSSGSCRPSMPTEPSPPTTRRDFMHWILVD